MKTCGYDMLLELDEKLLNKALAVVFYTGMLKASGSYSFVDGIPEELQGFTKIKYKVRLKNEPYVDLKETDKVFLKLSVELFLTVLTSVEVELDVDFHALADIRYDMANKKGWIKAKFPGSASNWMALSPSSRTAYSKENTLIFGLMLLFLRFVKVEEYAVWHL
jgi:hypothetical protein